MKKSGSTPEIMIMFHRILNLDHVWIVSGVEIDEENHQIVITVQHNGGELKCPECGRACKRHDNAPARKWRHLDTCQMQTFILCAVPRVRCPDDGVKTVQVPWADSHSRLTAAFEEFCRQILGACPVKSKVSEITGLSYDQLRQLQANTTV